MHKNKVKQKTETPELVINILLC